MMNGKNNKPKQKLVVIGNGMAGARTVEDILTRGGGELFDITVFGEEPHGSYNRILLSSVLSGTQDMQDIYLNPVEWYQENNITLRSGVRIAAIDRTAKQVRTANDETVSYDKLLIATGSRPFVPPMEGLKLADGQPKPGVFVFRTLEDCSKIASYATKCKRAVVIGGGLLGLEATRGLMNYGAQVHVVHLASHLMDQQLDADAGAMLKATMEKMGAQIHLQKITSTILGDDMVTGLEFKDGSKLDCDMVVISCGILPNKELAVECGLKVERAIVVDDHMRAEEDTDIYVVGECAQHRGRVYGLVTPLWEQAQVLADHLTGYDLNATYNGSKLATKLKVMGVELASMGVINAATEEDEVVQISEPHRGTYKKLIIRDDKLIGAILLGDLSKAATLMQALDKNTVLPEDRYALLFDFNASTKTKSTTMLEMPDEARVCNCNNVSKGEIRKCVLGGKHSVQGVMEATRAGTGCGSCKALVQDIVEWAAEGDLEPETLAPLSALSKFGNRSDAFRPEQMAAMSDTRALSPLELRKIADLADRCNVPMVRITDGYNVDLLGARKEDLLALWDQLA